MTPERALEWALDYEGCRRGQPLTAEARQAACEAAGTCLARLYRQGCDLSPEALGRWHTEAGQAGDLLTCRAIEWARECDVAPEHRSTR